MTDQIEQDIARGNRAQALMDDPLLIEAFDNLEKAYIDQWRQTNLNEAAGREWLFIAINVIGKVKANLSSVAITGRIAKADLDRLSKRK